MYIYICITIYYYILLVNKNFCFNSRLFRTVVSALSGSASRVLMHFLQMFLIRLNFF